MYPLLNIRDIVLPDICHDEDCRVAEAYLTMNNDNKIINNFIILAHIFIDTYQIDFRIKKYIIN